MTIKDIIGRDISIRIRCQKDYITFLKTAEEEGIRWQDWHKPMEHTEYFRENRQQEFFLNCRHGVLTWSPYTISEEIIDFSDLDLEDTEKYILEIKRKGRKISATLLSRNSVYIKHAIMSVAASIFTNGSSKNDLFGDEWLIIKRKSFNDMKVGDTVGDIKYVTSD